MSDKVTKEDFKALRGWLKLNQVQMAEELKVSERTIQRYESGETAISERLSDSLRDKYFQGRRDNANKE